MWWIIIHNGPWVACLLFNNDPASRDVLRIIDWHFNSPCAVRYRLNKMSYETRQQILRKDLSCLVECWTSHLHLVLTNLSIHRFVVPPPLAIISISSSALSVSVSGPVWRVSLWGKRNFLTWRKRSGTDTNMERLWHELHSKLLFSSTSSSSVPSLSLSLPPSSSSPLLLSPSGAHEAHGRRMPRATSCCSLAHMVSYLYSRWGRARGVWSITIHVCRCIHLLHLSREEYMCSYLCQYYVCLCNYKTSGCSEE